MSTEALILCGEATERVRELLDALAERGWNCVSVASPTDAPESPVPATAPRLLSLDGIPSCGLEALSACLKATAFEWVCLLPAEGVDEPRIRSLIENSAYAYHALPGDAVALDGVLRHAAAMAALRAPRATPEGCGPSESDQYEMVGTAPAMQSLFREIRKIAAVDAPVLIRGESGTGKELAAQSIHERSARADGPFVAVNCAALPGELVQSELFGHERGAFTGASDRRTGYIEAAEGGTLLLDEIGDLPLPLQVHLLRFLQQGAIQRVGGSGEVHVDVRVIAATHVSLEDAVTEGRFRADLYHRLEVLPLRIPALRDRPEDIEVLARFFFERFASECETGLRGLSRDALHMMRHHDWPGNVRELINRMRRAVVMCDSRMIQPSDLGIERRAMNGREPVSLEVVREHAERDAIRSAMARNDHVVARAARELEISRVTLYRLLEKHELIPARATGSPEPVSPPRYTPPQSGESDARRP